MNRFTFIDTSQLTDIESDIDLRIRNSSNSAQSEEIDQPEETDLPTTSILSTNNGRWCSDDQADLLLRPPDPSQSQLAKMALHFVLSSPITPEAQGIGYVEVSSVTWLLLRALVYKIIKALQQCVTDTEPHPEIASAAPLNSFLLKKKKKKNSHQKFMNQPRFASASTTTTASSSSSSTQQQDAWNTFTRFSDKIGLEGIQMISLLPPSTNIPDWAQSNAARPTVAIQNKCIAIVFDGSSHARAFAKRMTDPTAAGYRCTYHPSQPGVEILFIGDIIHIFKRYRNNLIASKIYVAPDVIENAQTPTPLRVPFFQPITLELYRQLREVDKKSILSICRLSEAAVNLTPRTKQSFPFAKELLGQRTQILLDRLEKREPIGSPRAHLIRGAKTASHFACRLICRTRSRWVLNTSQHRSHAAKQLLQLKDEFYQWRLRNIRFHSALIEEDQRLGNLNTEFSFGMKQDVPGFFDANFTFDLVTTLAGLARLCYYLPEVCLRLITTDVVESLFSTVRSVVRGGGQLNVASHRWSVKRAYILRLNLFGYLGEGITRTQSLANFLVNSVEKKMPQPISVQFISPSLAFVQSAEITEEDRAIFRYVSGWMLHVLLKNFEDDQLADLIECFIGRLIKSVPKFESFIGRLIINLHCAMLKNKEWEKIHPQLVEFLERTCAGDFQTCFHGADYAVFKMICQKTTSMFLADRLRRNKVIGSKSFRNALPESKPIKIST